MKTNRIRKIYDHSLNPSFRDVPGLDVNFLVATKNGVQKLGNLRKDDSLLTLHAGFQKIVEVYQAECSSTSSFYTVDLSLSGSSEGPLEVLPTQRVWLAESKTISGVVNYFSAYAYELPEVDKASFVPRRKGLFFRVVLEKEAMIWSPRFYVSSYAEPA